MSQLLIQQYLNQLATLKKVSGTQRESVVREAFKDLLKGWAKSHDLVFIPEYELESKTKERRYVDGALLYELRVPFGYWEAKDPDDDLDAMVAAKFKRAKALMDLHTGYESVEPWKLKRTDVTDEKAKQAGQAPKPMLKANKEAGRIVLDSETTLAGVPKTTTPPLQDRNRP